LNVPKLLLVTPSAHLGTALAGEEDGGEDGVVAAEDEAAVVVEEGTEGEIMTVMPRQREKENNRQGRKAPPQMPMWVRREGELWSQTGDLMSECEGMLLLRPFKARKRPR